MNYAVVRHLYAAISATINDAAHLDVPYDAYLAGIDCVLACSTLATSDRIEVEVSTASVCQFTTNDCSGVLGNFSVQGLAASGLGVVNKFIGPLNVFVPRGTRIFINALVNGTPSGRAGVNLYLVPK